MLKGAFTTSPNAPDEIRIVEVVHDWGAFYAPVLDPKLKGISAAKCFKFKGDANDECRMFYKDFMISKEDKPRPFQPGDIFRPRSDAEAAATFGVLWEASSAEVSTRHDTTLHNTTLHDTTRHYTTHHALALREPLSVPRALGRGTAHLGRGTNHFDLTISDDTTRHCTTRHYTTRHYTTLHDTTRNDTTRHYTALHYMPSSHDDLIIP